MSIVTQRIYTGDSIVYAGENGGGGGGGLSAVVHDATLTGDGTAASPLSAVLGLWPTISFTSGSLAISHGIFYIGTDIANLTLSLNTVSGAEYHLKFTTSSTIGTFDFSAVTSWIGNSPSISASTTYEIDILDGVGIIATVG